jgi:hypothetical protein
LAAGIALHCCNMAGRHSALSLCFLSVGFISYFHPCAPSTWHLQQSPVPTTDRQLSSLHIRRGNNRCGIPQFKLCWASCMFYPCILHCTPLPSFLFGQTLSWGFVCLIDDFRGRNNRMDLSNEPPMTYVTTVPVDTASLDGMGSLTRRYVLTLPFEEEGSEQRC